MAEEETEKKPDNLESLVSVSVAGLEAYLGWEIATQYLPSILGYSATTYLGYGIAAASAVVMGYLGYKFGQFAYKKILKPVGSKIIDAIYYIGSTIESLVTFGSKKEKAPSPG